MSTGIFVTHQLNSYKLKSYLSNPNNHIQLLFPYLDYGMNYFKKEKNKISEYENRIILDGNTQIQQGQVVPNYKINDNLRLREYVRLKQNETEMPFYFFILNSITSENELILKIPKIKNISYHVLINKINSEFYIKELEEYKLILIRPDYIIEYIN